MFCVGDHVLGIQGHPEYTADILLSLVDRLSSSQSITVSSLSCQSYNFLPQLIVIFPS
jgi:GMP synthase-like glutamine amidotransferase